jgi:D-alanine--poly(phosphoribitol) ligase subunit 2
MDTRERVRSYLFETLIPLPPAARPPDDADLFSHGMDSLRLMQLLVFIEENLGVRLPDHEVTPERVSSVRSVVDWIDSHRRA